jgi:hypothetical protein
MQALTQSEMEHIEGGGFLGELASGVLGGLAGRAAGLVVIDALEIAAGPAGWVVLGATSVGIIGGVLMDA